MDQGFVKIKQDRQWTLTDRMGTSSAFFAETLQNLFKEWSSDVDLFFESVYGVAEELEDWLRDLLMKLGSVGQLLSPLVDGIAQATRGAREGQQARLKSVFEAIGLDRNELSGTRVVVDSQIPPLFGYQPWKAGIGYRLYVGDETPDKPEMRHNQVFPAASFVELLQGLWENSGNAANPGSNRHAAICRQQLEVQPNRWFGIGGGKSVGFLWVYNTRVRDSYPLSVGNAGALAIGRQVAPGLAVDVDAITELGPVLPDRNR